MFYRKRLVGIRLYKEGGEEGGTKRKRKVGHFKGTHDLMQGKRECVRER